jgi:predicted nucleic acid-binding protein
VNYIDTSVALALLLNEKRHPPPSFWSKQKTSSRLLEYEIVVRLNALRMPPASIKVAQDFLADVKLIDLDGPTLKRALQPFPVPLRTLDAIHLSTLVFLQERGVSLQMATYDKRLGRAAEALGVKLAKV